MLQIEFIKVLLFDCFITVFGVLQKIQFRLMTISQKPYWPLLQGISLILPKPTTVFSFSFYPPIGDW